VVQEVVSTRTVRIMMALLLSRTAPMIEVELEEEATTEATEVVKEVIDLQEKVVTEQKEEENTEAEVVQEVIEVQEKTDLPEEVMTDLQEEEKTKKRLRSELEAHNLLLLSELLNV
jgi:GDP-D-mannose dehydratase